MPRPRATYQEVLDAPDGVVAQIIDGQLVLLPRPAKPHTLAASALGAELFPPFHQGKRGPGGWIVLDEPELHFGEDILVPDLAGWRRERMPVLSTDVPYFTLAPDWACEVLSPRTATLDRAGKLPIYAREKVGHMWLVDPERRSLEVMRREGDKWLLVGVWHDDARVRAEPFEAIELELTGLWADVEKRDEPAAAPGA